MDIFEFLWHNFFSNIYMNNIQYSNNSTSVMLLSHSLIAVFYNVMWQKKVPDTSDLSPLKTVINIKRVNYIENFVIINRLISQKMVNQIEVFAWSFFSDHWNSHAGDSNVLLWRHNSVSKPYVDVLIHGLAFYWPVVSTETWRRSLRTLNRVNYWWISCDVTRLRHIPRTQCHLT